MSNLTIQQFCQLETLKAELNLFTTSDYQCTETIKDNLTVLEVTNPEREIVQEFILVV